MSVVLGRRKKDLIELLKSTEEIKLNTWTHIAITFSKETADLILYIDGKKQEYASLWQGIDYFINSGVPRCTMGNMPEPLANATYQLYGSMMDFYILNSALSDDGVDLLRGMFHGYLCIYKRFSSERSFVRCGGLMLSTLYPDRVVQLRTLAGVVALFSWV